MTALIVIAAILLVLTLIGRIPLAADVVWNAAGFGFSARVWFFTIRLGGSAESGEAKDKEPRPKDKKETPAKEKKMPSWPVLKILIQNGYRTLCRLLSRLRADILKVHFTAASADPSTAAMMYAAAGTAMDGLLRVGGDRISHPDLRASVDFDSETIVIDLHLRLSIRVYQAVGAALGFGWGFLRDYWKLKKEDAKNGKSSDR